MENVPQLMKFKAGKMFKNLSRLLRAADYHVEWDVLYGPDYGLAQTRSRLYFWLRAWARSRSRHQP